MKKIWKEFKAFAFKGNVIDLAVGMMIGSAFTAIVTALVNSVMMPLLSLLTGKVDFQSMSWTVGGVMGEEGLEGGTVIPYGAFLQAVFNFTLIAICIFVFVKLIKKLRDVVDDDDEVAPVPVPVVEPKRLCPFCFGEIHNDATRCPHCTSVLDK